MPSLLLVVLLVQLAIHLVNTIGASAINDFIWTLYTKIPGNTTARDDSKQQELQRDVLKLKKEMEATSSQDEFAKWARIRRQHDKKLEDYNEISNSLKALKTKFETTGTVLRFTSTTGLRFFLQFWYAKTPIYWLPRGWVPGYIEWVLCFPRAPVGSVSVQVWGIACASVVGMVGKAVVAGYALTQTQGKEGVEQGGGVKVEKEEGKKGR